MGNLTKIDRAGTGSDWVFSYDPYSRQTCARQASSTCSGTGAISYLLDPFGRASSRTKGSSSTTYAYRGISETLAKTVSGSTTMTYAATPSGTPLAQQKNGQASSTRYFLQDPHGDLVGLVTKDPAFKGTVSFDPWGTKLGTSGTESSVLGFQSDLTDPDSGLVDMGTRFYVPSLGRFSTRDVLFGKVQNPASLNMFAYGLGAPATYVDPTGMGTCNPNEYKCHADKDLEVAEEEHVDWVEGDYEEQPTSPQRPIPTPLPPAPRPVPADMAETPFGLIYVTVGACRDDYRNLVTFENGAGEALTLQAPAARSFRYAERRLGSAIRVTGTWRSCERQAELFAQDPGRYADPDTTRHTRGLAIDVHMGILTPQVVVVLEEAGWHRTRPEDEPWHFSYWEIG